MPDCLSIEMLRSWLADELSSSEGAMVAAHVAGCTVCQSRLDAETDTPTLQHWLEIGRDRQIEDVDLAVVDKLLSEHRPPPPRATPARRRSSGPKTPVAGFPEPEADIGRIGAFRLLAELGRGGMGIVYRAWDEPLGRVVAVKVLRPEHAGEADRLRLVREARLASQFQNDHAVTIHSVVDPPDGLPYLVMEYVAGPTLAELISSGRRPLPRELAEQVAQAALAVDAAHAAGLVHRDIKPSNILIDTASGRAKITDFGVARSLTAPSTITRDGALAGTPAYMSPEQARGEPDLDPRTDVYSLGATLYEGLTGQPPFAGALHAVLRRIIADDPLPPRRFDQEIPADLETICLKAMAKEPSRRYQTARALADDLRRWQRAEPIQARPAGPLERGWRWGRRRPLVAGLALALVVALTAGVAGISWKWAEAVHERRRTELERDRAQRNFRQAREAVDTYLTQVSDSEVLKAQNLEPLRRELLRTARDFYERFVEQDPDDPDLQAELGRAHARLGLITTALESKPRALEHFQKMGAIFERLHEAHPGNPVYQRELAESYLRQGESLRTGGGTLAQATAALLLGRKLQEELVRAHPAVPDYHYDLARSLRSLGNFYLFVSADHGQAEEVLLAAREIHGRLPATYLRQPPVQFERAVLTLNLAKLYAHTDRPLEHRAASAAASTLLEPLARDHAGNPDYVWTFTDSLNELGESYRSLAQPDLARTTLEKALGSAENLARSHPANGYYRHLVADIAYTLASLHFHERHEPALGRVLLAKALEIEQELAINFPAVGEYVFYLNNIVRDFRDWFDDSARLNAVCDHFTVLIQEYEKRPPPEARDQLRLARYYQHRGQIQLLLRRYSAAHADFKQSGWTELASITAARLESQRGKYAQAEATAIQLAERDPASGPNLYSAAQIGACMAAVVRHDPALASAQRQELGEKFSRQAVEWLKKAQALKYLSAPSTRYLLADDRDLEPMRSRADFQALLDHSREATVR
jgi:tetratricopeptide (TPR) repeat protein/predicted Ser/Thr protein kinase